MNKTKIYEMKKKEYLKLKNETHELLKKIPSNSHSLIFNNENKKLFILTKDILINQLRRDNPKIESSFDKICDQELKILSVFFSDTLSILYAGLVSVSQKNLESTCAELLLNTSNSFVAATQLLRSGHLLQPGIIIRSMLEAISTTLYLIQNPDDLILYEQGKLNSTKTFKSAKKLLPILGDLYGYFSDNFAHIGHLHRSLQKISEYKEHHEALDVNLSFLKIILWLLYVTTELLFNDIVKTKRYWQPISEGYLYAPSENEQQWMHQFFGANIPA